MAYKKGDENKYFPAIVAALLVIAIGLGTFIYNALMVPESDYEEILIEETASGISVSPGNAQPTAPPSYEQPTFPPPSN